MSVQKHGVEYLKSYAGILKIAEEVLNLAVLISGSICGYNLKTFIINIDSIYALCTTALFLFVNYRSIFRKSSFPWDWVECANSTTIAAIFLLGASVAMSELTKKYIITGAFPSCWIKNGGGCFFVLILAKLWLVPRRWRFERETKHSQFRRIWIMYPVYFRIIGYIASMVYVLETIDKFKLAVTPRARYVWTTPNMPE